MSGMGAILPRLFSGDDEHHSHSVHLYAEDASLVDALGRFVAPVLHGGEAAVIVATPQHRLALARNLVARGVDISGTARQGRYVTLDASDTLSLFTLEGWPEPARFADCLGDVLTRARVAAGNRQSPVAVFGEMVALLWAEGKFEAALQLEKLWNQLARTQLFHLRCAYSIGAFGGAEHETPFLKICAEHSRVLPSIFPYPRSVQMSLAFGSPLAAKSLTRSRGCRPQEVAGSSAMQGIRIGGPA